MLDGEHQRGSHEHGQEMIPAVTHGAVRVGVAVVSREQSIQRFLEVVLRTAPELHQGETRRGVGKEHVYQPVASRLRRERPDAPREIHDPAAARVDVELDRLHPPTLQAPSIPGPS